MGGTVHVPGEDECHWSPRRRVPLRLQISSYSACNVLCERAPAHELLPVATCTPTTQSFSCNCTENGKTRSRLNRKMRSELATPGGFRGASHPRRAHRGRWERAGMFWPRPEALVRKLLEVFGAMSPVHRVTSCFLAPLMQPGRVFHGCVRRKKEARVRQAAPNRVWDNTEGHAGQNPLGEVGARGPHRIPPLPTGGRAWPRVPAVTSGRWQGL